VDVAASLQADLQLVMEFPGLLNPLRNSKAFSESRAGLHNFP